MIKRFATGLSVALLALVVGCKSSPAPASDAGAEAAAPSDQRAGLQVNNASSVGLTVAELEVVGWAKASADATGDASTPEQAVGAIGSGPLTIPIAAATFQPTSTLTASDTNPATLYVYKRNTFDAGASTQTLIASVGTGTTADGGSGNWYAFSPVPLTVVSGAFVSPGDTITVVISKTVPGGGAGTVVPSGNLSLFGSIQ